MVQQAKLDSAFVFRGILPQAEKGKIDFHFSEPKGKTYRLKLLSRRPDSLQHIDIVPSAIQEGTVLPIRRISSIKLTKEEGYFSYSFDVSMRKEYDYVQLFFEQFNVPDTQKTDLVLLVYRK